MNKRSVFTAAFLSIANTIVMIGLAELLGPVSLGEFAIVLVVVSVATSFLCGGIPASILYYRSANKIDSFGIRKVARLHLCLVIVPALLTSIVCVTFVSGKDSKFLAVLLLLSLVFQIGKSDMLAIVYSYKKMHVANLMQFLSILVKIVTYCLLFAKDHGVLDLVDAIAITVAEDFIYFLFLIKFLLRKKRNGVSNITFWECQRYGWRIGLANLITGLFYRSDVVLLGWLTSAYFAGQYSFATQLVEKTWFLTNAISTVIIPKYSRTKKNELSEKVNKILVLVTFVNIVASFLLTALAFYIITNYMPQYNYSFSMMLVLVPGIILMSASKIYSNFNVALGDNRSNLSIVFLLLPVLILLDAILIPTIGPIGAALSCSILYGFHAFLTRRNFNMLLSS